MSLPGTGMSSRVSIRSATARRIAAASVRVGSAVGVVVMEGVSFEGARGPVKCVAAVHGPAVAVAGLPGAVLITVTADPGADVLPPARQRPRPGPVLRGLAERGTPGGPVDGGVFDQARGRDDRRGVVGGLP